MVGGELVDDGNTIAGDKLALGMDPDGDGGTGGLANEGKGREGDGVERRGGGEEREQGWKGGRGRGRRE